MITSASPPSLDVYDVAFLAGGSGRLVDTAVVGLVLTGRLRVHSTGQLATVDLTRRHPVEAAVLDAVGPTGHRSVDTICWRLRDDDRLAAVGVRLRSQGLLGRPGVPHRRAEDHRSSHLTRLGHRTLSAWVEKPRDTEELRVALGGRGAMADHLLRAEIFEPPCTSLTPPGPHGRSRDVDHSDPHLAAYRTGGTAAAAGVYLSFTDAW
jgi:hypothetical protein